MWVIEKNLKREYYKSCETGKVVENELEIMCHSVSEIEKFCRKDIILISLFARKRQWSIQNILITVRQICWMWIKYQWFSVVHQKFSSRN